MYYDSILLVQVHVCMCAVKCWHWSTWFKCVGTGGICLSVVSSAAAPPPLLSKTYFNPTPPCVNNLEYFYEYFYEYFFMIILKCASPLCRPSSQPCRWVACWWMGWVMAPSLRHHMRTWTSCAQPASVCCRSVTNGPVRCWVAGVWRVRGSHPSPDNQLQTAAGSRMYSLTSFELLQGVGCTFSLQKHRHGMIMCKAAVADTKA
jgi:hypothetical protein